MLKWEDIYQKKSFTWGKFHQVTCGKFQWNLMEFPFHWFWLRVIWRNVFNIHRRRVTLFFFPFSSLSQADSYDQYYRKRELFLFQCYSNSVTLGVTFKFLNVTCHIGSLCSDLMTKVTPMLQKSETNWNNSRFFFETRFVTLAKST